MSRGRRPHSCGWTGQTKCLVLRAQCRVGDVLDVLNPVKISAAKWYHTERGQEGTFFIPRMWRQHTRQSEILIQSVFCYSFHPEIGDKLSLGSRTRRNIFSINNFNDCKWIINVSGRQYQSSTWQIYFQDRVKLWVSVISHINSQSYQSLHLHVYIVQTKSVHGDTTRYHRLDNIILFTLISDIADNLPIKVTISGTQ